MLKTLPYFVGAVFLVVSMTLSSSAHSESVDETENSIQDRINKEKFFLENVDVLSPSSYEEGALRKYFPIKKIVWEKNTFREHGEIIAVGGSSTEGESSTSNNVFVIYAHYPDNSNLAQDDVRMNLARIVYVNFPRNELFNVRRLISAFGWPTKIFRANSLIEERFSESDDIYKKTYNKSLLFQIDNRFSYVDIYVTTDQFGVVSRQNFQFRRKDDE